MPFYKKRLGGDVSAIFVHAGAGYHSTQNEKVHLQACADAAKAAMTFLKNGGTAVDAVEVAIKVLEDKEITNAGYGSNLAIDGTVECDATMVDHFGRSGAVGAVAQINNPIHLARLILEHSTKPLSLRRVPPNLLVGQGATDFAYECGMPVLPNDYLVSPSAKERWNRWSKDLRQAIRHEEGSHRSGRSETTEADEQDQRSQSDTRPAYNNHQLSGLRNESQPYSPRLRPNGSSEAGSLEDFPIRRQTSSPGSASFVASHLDQATPAYHQLYTDSVPSPNALPNIWLSSSLQGNDGQFSHHHNEKSDDSDASFVDDHLHWDRIELTGQRNEDQNSERSSRTTGSESGVSLPSLASPLPIESQLDGLIDIPLESYSVREDDITDTVGAIAVDFFGNIAAGSSSGGIGMKHKGRTGPAALVGIGTSVIPIDANDKTKTCTAAVTSGTGEHMATTAAASVCATRLYLNQKKGTNGLVVTTDEEGALRGFVEKDFMGHPSVKNSHSTGAIGILAVKKTVDGVWLHFVHNTDSFALASMHSEEEEPACVMSRGKGNSTITSGARSIRHPIQKPNSLRNSLTGEPKMKRQRSSKPS